MAGNNDFPYEVDYRLGNGGWTRVAGFEQSLDSLEYAQGQAAKDGHRYDYRVVECDGGAGKEIWVSRSDHDKGGDGE